MLDQQIFETVKSVIVQTLTEKGMPADTLTYDTPLGQTGLDSLEWAVVVVQLQDTLNIDPFELGINGELQTVSDLATLYVRGLKDNAA